MAEPRRSAVFVTGGSGYVGGHVLSSLTRAGWSVRALTRRSGSTGSGANVTWVPGDLTDVPRFASALDGCVALVHCARATHGDVTERSMRDVEGTLALWDAAARAGIRRFIHVSTISVYDLPAEGRLTNPARLRDRSVLARLRREVGRRLSGRRPIFPADDFGIRQAASRAEFSPARAAALLQFRASRVFT